MPINATLTAANELSVSVRLARRALNRPLPSDKSWGSTPQLRPTPYDKRDCLELIQKP